MTQRDKAPDVMSFPVSVAWCRTCKEVIGPDLAEDVGESVAIGEHETCDTEIIDTWEETESPDSVRTQ